MILSTGGGGYLGLLTTLLGFYQEANDEMCGFQDERLIRKSLGIQEALLTCLSETLRISWKGRAGILTNRIDTAVRWSEVSQSRPVNIVHWLIGESQQNVAYWEQSEKPPRSDVLPKLAHVLGVSVEQILDVKTPIARRSGPVGKVRTLFEDVSELPRRQQDKVVELVSALVQQYRRQTG